MTDQQTPDTITWANSGIILKQLAIVGSQVAVIATIICSLFGVTLTQGQLAQISALAVAVGVLGFSIWTIHNRATKPCPPIQPKPPQTGV